MKLDMHCHTKEGSVDGKIPIEEYIKSLIAQGYDGMLVTDHDSYGGYRYYLKNLKSKYKDFTVFMGIEYATGNAGHMIVIMPRGMYIPILEIKGMPVQALIRLVHFYGGIIGPAHPFGEPNLSMFSTLRFKKKYEYISKFDFIEGYNCGEDDKTNQKAQAIAKEYHTPATGGSDSHIIENVGLAYTILDESPKNNDELIEYIKARKPMACGGTQFMGTLKQKLGPWNKLLVWAFWPYNKAGAYVRHGKRKGEITKIRTEAGKRIKR